jgi:hypothetical protein
VIRYAHPRMDILRLAYRSIRVPGLTDEALLRTLIAPAYLRNRAEGITGCLWCGEYSFVQVVEGSPDAVHNLMARIVNDPRHRKLTVLSSSLATVPLFDSWGLKWVRGRDCLGVEQLIDSLQRPEVAPDADTTERGGENGGGGGRENFADVASTPLVGGGAEPVVPVIVVRRIIAELVRAEPTYF